MDRAYGTHMVTYTFFLAPPRSTQPMNWLFGVESCLQHSHGHLSFALVSSPANKLAS